MSRGIGHKTNMSVRKVKNHWQVSIYHNSQRKRVRSPEDSKRGAQAYESVIRHRLAQGESFEDIFAPKKKGEWMFADYVEYWFETYVLVENKRSEQLSKRSRLETHILPYFGKIPLTKVSAQHISLYKALKLKTLSAKTVNNHLAIIGKCLRSAHEWGDVDSVPRYKLLRTDPPNTTCLTVQECDNLLDAAHDDPFWYLFIVCALNTGMRPGELFALIWENVDFTTNQIWVRQNLVDGILGSPKSNKHRQIPLTALLAESLYPIRKQRGYVFQRNGQPLTSGIAWHALRRIRGAAGLPKLRWKTLRHTFASLLVQRNVPIHDVQKLLGHGTIQMTMRYLHLAPNSLTDAIMCFPDFAEKSGHHVGTSREITAPTLALPMKPEALISAETTIEKAPPKSCSIW